MQALNFRKLKDMTIFITGASRGIGKAIALKAAKDGANIVIAAKTAEPHPKLPGTIFTAAKEVEDAGGKALPCVVDVRDEAQITKAVKDAVAKFGGIDILINNASAISLTPTLETDLKRYDLMQNINTRGTFLVSKVCLPYLKKGKNPHILNLSPPLNLNPMWFENHLAYTIAKYGMSLCVLGMHKEFQKDGIAVNALWPRTAIMTAAIEMLTGPDSANHSRKPEIVADAAYAILTKDSKTVTGNFFIDDEVLKSEGITDFKNYACNPDNAENLMPDFFLGDPPTNYDQALVGSAKKQEGSASGSVNYEEKIEHVFQAIKSNINEDVVRRIQAVFQFNVKGPSEGVWYIDLKNGKGQAGRGKPSVPPDATLTMSAKDFFDLFSGKLKATAAFMSGKLKISGKMQEAMKLEKLMNSLKSKL
ncbi:glucose 1-dehydrogenase, putative [Pediculus humanus corporis]|uniref:Hydroxysteroid dehydrogenase-like protein 2 n=1 Tax=Pediculus humanus subsp. corporis TaxID=121224 RepID=E0VM98_PEDHC|nr:glucose 1-dehydrogenase, putative [Pediculus humanus corporis]EEB14504.1 glucose 1-dehydrogenase, putative [Pediculus humanus corporis]